MSDSMTAPRKTGLVCPKCQQPTGIITSPETELLLTFVCETCAFEWVSLHPTAAVRPAKPPNEHGD
jgi:hypothetical protein